MAFEEFESCSQEGFVDCLYNYYINQKWDLGSFNFLLQNFSANKVIQTKEDKHELLTKVNMFMKINHSRLTLLIN